LAQVGFSGAALKDFERIHAFYAQESIDLAIAQAHALHQAISILGAHPLIGRVVRSGLRELVISQGKTGFLALYRHLPQHDLVWVLRIRHQRELGYGA